MKKKTSFGVKLAAFITVLALSWSFTCGILCLAALCFSTTFCLKIATGIWLLFVLLRTYFGPTKSKS